MTPGLLVLVALLITVEQPDLPKIRNKDLQKHNLVYIYFLYELA